jgi:pilus assembly protein CpaE
MSQSAAKIRVLIVDDLQTTRENMAKLLFFVNGIEVVGLAESGADAVAKALKLEPALAVLDATLPGEEVSEVLAQLVAVCPELRIVLVSVEGSAHHFASPLPVGVRALLVKPISGDALVLALRHAAAR